MTLQTSEPLPRHSLPITNRFADFFVRNVQRGEMLLDPPYQRGDVWTRDQQMGLVKSWMLGIPIPAVIINDRGNLEWMKANPQDDDCAYAVIDGKQRILTAVAWLTGELLVPASWFPTKYVETTEDTDDGPYVRYTGLTEVGQRFAELRCSFPCTQAQVATVEEEAEIYLLVNGAGTAQTDADLANAARVAGGE